MFKTLSRLNRYFTAYINVQKIQHRYFKIEDTLSRNFISLLFRLYYQETQASFICLYFVFQYSITWHIILDLFSLSI